MQLKLFLSIIGKSIFLSISYYTMQLVAWSMMQRNTNKQTETQRSKQLSRIANKQAETKPTKRGAMSIPIKTEDIVIDRGLTSAEISEGGGGALNGVDA